MPLDGAETVALIVLLDLRTGGSRSQHRWVVETIEVFFFSPFFFKHYYFFIYLFYKQASLRWRALCLTEWQFTNTIISTNPLSSLLRSLDCQTTQQPLLCSKPLFTLSSPTANHLHCLQMTCSFIEARTKKSEKLFIFIFAKMYKCDKSW